MSDFTLEDLETIVAARLAADPSQSYTAKLAAKGQSAATKKLGEEAVETIIAALSGSRTELTKESADLLFHLLVVLAIADIPLKDVLDELASRTAQSGLAEKAARRPD